MKADATGERAAIYCRVSTAKQEDEGTSLDTQDARCRAFCAERGLVVVGAFTDVYTGAKYRERDGLKAVRKGVRSGEIDVVVTYAIDRLSRNQAHLAIIAEEVEDFGARLAFVTEDFEDSAVGKFIRSANGFAAEIEREKIAERTVRGRLARVQSGKMLPGCRALYGYRWRDDAKTALMIDPGTGPVVRRIARDVLSGKSLRSIVLALDAEGVPSPTGKKWSISTVSQMLGNDTYTGRATGFRYQHIRERDGRKTKHIRPVEERVALPEGTIPALIDPSDFASIARRLTLNKQHAARNNQTPAETLLRAGIARCGVCGHALFVARDSSGVNTYRCNSRVPCSGQSIRAGILDGAVWDGVRSRLLNRELIAAELERLRRDDPTRADGVAIDRRLAEVTRKQANLTRELAAEDDADVAALIRADLAGLAKERRRLQAEHDDLEHQREGWRQAQQRLEDLDVWAENVRLNLDDIEAEYAKKRFALDACHVDVRVWPSGHDPRWQAKMQLGGQELIVYGTS